MKGVLREKWKNIRKNDLKGVENGTEDAKSMLNNIQKIV